ncbi:ATP-dependent RecD-like DNA helicase [Brevibacillus marinus]|uniref:SF1B family DNA helicase RecD2 n=1 Tax=Brevibacillus marinus TaxID=2496837 RepID=UPI000F81F983|nr:ATP-dependent RecD-like DNA helicase [Brevibacillus marinus]
MVELTGTIQHIIFRKDEFLIAKFATDEGVHTIKGLILGVEKSEEITVFGDWTNDPKYGLQFSVHRWERPIPRTSDQVLAFLSSPLIKGCGLKIAKAIVEALGSNALNIILEKGEECLTNIKGIGPKNAKRIVESVKNTYELQRILFELQGYGLPDNIVTRAYQKFGSNTSEIIKRNPYELTKINLIGFIKADEVAKRIGILPNSLFRIESAILYKLKEMCYDEGHCFIPENDLLIETLKILNHNVEQSHFVTQDDIRLGLVNLEDQNRIVIEKDRVYLPYLYKCEKRLAKRIQTFLRQKKIPVWEELIHAKIREYQNKNGIILVENQRKAILTLFQQNLMILTGGPGVGKTATTKAIIDVFSQIHPEATIKLAAPTGRASRKLSEVTGIDAYTIHRLIGMKVGSEPEYNETNPIMADLLIIDEFSMVDIQLADMLFAALSPTTKVLLVGDPDQLPSVNPGNVLSDLLSAGVPHVALNHIFRQAEGSQIITNAHRINKGLPIRIDPTQQDFFFLERTDPEEIAQTIRRGVKQLIMNGYSPSDIMILSPIKRGVIGTEELNAAMQAEINPPSPNKKEVTLGKTVYREGDKVIHIRNNPQKDVFNGDLGIIHRIDYLVDEAGVPTDELGIYCMINGREIPYSLEDLKELQLGYCITIHKSQGGQAPIVIIPVSTSHYKMLAKNLLYTGVTRAEQIVFLIGSKKALNIAIHNNRVVQRNTTLQMRIYSNEIHEDPVSTSQLQYAF